MKVRITWKPGVQVSTTAIVPHGRDFEFIGATAADLGQPKEAVVQALTRTFEEVAKLYPRAARWVSEGESPR